eukprot:333468-Rhodomonas_salina.1
MAVPSPQACVRRRWERGTVLTPKTAGSRTWHEELSWSTEKDPQIRKGEGRRETDVLHCYHSNTSQDEHGGTGTGTRSRFRPRH